MNYLISLFLMVSMITCHSNSDVQPVRGQGLAGTWLLYETGYSPGAGYIVDKVPTSPQQTLTFTADGKIQAQGDKLKSYQSYTQFSLDSTANGVHIRYAPTNNATYFERVTVRNDTLTLSPPCIEGCHSAFIRIK
ncbi:hypothetical protein GCM10028805_38450 [Spirosoma harenae]